MKSEADVSKMLQDTIAEKHGISATLDMAKQYPPGTKTAIIDNLSARLLQLNHEQTILELILEES